MIICRTPFRISFFGGGTDYKEFAENYGGSVLNTTINKYCYIMLRYLPPYFKYKYYIRYRLNEKRSKISTIQHPTVRECLKYMNIDKGIELVHTAYVPARSGIGSSSSFTVCFLHALNAMKGNAITKRQLALDAINIEQNLIGESIGYQDQSAAAFGGINVINYNKANGLVVNTIPLDRDFLYKFQDSIMLFFTRLSRTASEVASTYVNKLSIEKKEELIAMKSMVSESIDILNHQDIEKFGKLLDKSWSLKRSLSKNISNRDIDDMYSLALNNGAFGGKICGAGGGGFLLLLVDKKYQENVKKALKKLLYVPFKFDFLGSQIITYNQQDF